jgi:Grx4 family monothiol glutaredoxin
MALSDALKGELDELVAGNDVLLFMKGHRGQPQCGFSARVVEILDRLVADYATVDVLSRPDVREGIKEYSDWPTIPQLYVKGEFVGGADIVQQMFAAGELQDALGCAPDTDVRASPLVDGTVRVELTSAAAEAIGASRDEDDGPFLRFEISDGFEHALYFDDKNHDDVVIEAGGHQLVVDPVSAKRASGAHIDYVKEAEREGFKITNPNKPDTPDKPAAKAPPRPENPPAFTVTDQAFQQFEAALAEEDGDAHGVRVGARRMGAAKADYELGIIGPDEKTADDFEVTKNGIRFWVDPMSARSLDGATIDFVDSGDASGFKFDNPKLAKGWPDARANDFQRLLDDEINPSIASHGGVIELLDFIGDNAYVLMGGGCQGCGMAAVTLQQGIQERVSQVMPGVVLVDTTDHSAGSNPYYQAGK